MNNRNMAFLCGLGTGFLLKGLCDALAHPSDRAAAPGRDIRQAGRRQMKNPPRNWDMVDEQGDESFPASDPPGNY